MNSVDPSPQSASRDAARTRFLDHAGYSRAALVALKPDASFRRYFRVGLGNETRLLMDAPPPEENVAAFVRVDEHLRDLGLAAPDILARDLEQGFLLLEDFGDETFTRLLANGRGEVELYRLAVDTLLALQCHPRAIEVDVPAYDLDALLGEALLLPDWHYRLVHGTRIDAGARAAYGDAWRNAFSALPPPAMSLVLRDYHVDNLMLVTRADTEHCGLLDFQDALIGPSAYDLASLLQDARRDIPPDLEAEFLDYFLARMPLLQHDNFRAWYAMLAAQRHAKVIGIFSRLCLRDGKCHYLRHLPRVIRRLQSALSMPGLEPLGAWLDRHLPDRLAYTATHHDGEIR